VITVNSSASKTTTRSHKHSLLQKQSNEAA